jgi:thiol:disulfide interchange protein DsbD
MSIYGALLLVGASGGGDDVLQPLKGVLVASGDAQDQEGLRFRQVKGPDQLRRAIASANRRGKPVMLDFYADWCVSCKEMERYTFSDESVQAALSEAVLLQADVTANDVQDRALLRSLNLFGPPAILFFTPTGHERHDWRVVGYMSAERFSRHVRQALGTASSAS